MSEENKTSVKDAISIYITPSLLAIISVFLMGVYNDIKDMKTDLEEVKREQHTMKSQFQSDREYHKSDKEAVNKFHEKISENIEFLKEKTNKIELDIAKNKRK